MEMGKKAGYKAELMGLKAALTGAAGLLAQLNQTTYPVTGPSVTIHTLPMAANAIQMQTDTVAKLMTLLERVIDDV